MSPSSLSESTPFSCPLSTCAPTRTHAHTRARAVERPTVKVAVYQKGPNERASIQQEASEQTVRAAKATAP
eukprot:5238377-Prymnesium_polylepis.1